MQFESSTVFLPEVFPAAGEGSAPVLLGDMWAPAGQTEWLLKTRHQLEIWAGRLKPVAVAVIAALRPGHQGMPATVKRRERWRSKNKTEARRGNRELYISTTKSVFNEKRFYLCFSSLERKGSICLTLPHFSVVMTQESKAITVTPTGPLQYKSQACLSKDFCYIVVWIQIPAGKRRGCNLYSAVENKALKS